LNQFCKFRAGLSLDLTNGSIRENIFIQLHLVTLGVLKSHLEIKLTALLHTLFLSHDSSTLAFSLFPSGQLTDPPPLQSSVHFSPGFLGGGQRFSLSQIARRSRILIILLTVHLSNKTVGLRCPGHH